MLAATCLLLLHLVGSCLTLLLLLRCLLPLLLLLSCCCCLGFFVSQAPSASLCCCSLLFLKHCRVHRVTLPSSSSSRSSSSADLSRINSYTYLKSQSGVHLAFKACSTIMNLLHSCAKASGVSRPGLYSRHPCVFPWGQNTWVAAMCFDPMCFIAGISQLRCGQPSVTICKLHRETSDVLLIEQGLHPCTVLPPKLIVC